MAQLAPLPLKYNCIGIYSYWVPNRIELKEEKSIKEDIGPGSRSNYKEKSANKTPLNNFDQDPNPNK